MIYCASPSLSASNARPNSRGKSGMRSSRSGLAPAGLIEPRCCRQSQQIVSCLPWIAIPSQHQSSVVRNTLAALKECPTMVAYQMLVAYSLSHSMQRTDRTACARASTTGRAPTSATICYHRSKRRARIRAISSWRIRKRSRIVHMNSQHPRE